MRFAEPHWLLVGLVAVTLLVLLLVRAELLKSRALALLERARLRARSSSPSRPRRWLRVVVTTLAVALGFVALARPQKGMEWETMERTGADLLLVVDTSKSMDADDVKPTRLERAKLAIRDLVDRFPGDRIGLVAFAGDAFEQSPMTLDHGALLESLDALDTSVIARRGTNLGRGIDVAAAALATEPGRQKVMVLLTDGEDLEGQGLDEARQAASAGITIEAVGVGTLAGELVPARDARGATIGVLRDEDGTPVRSHLDEAGLKAIADAAHGSYRPLGADGRGLDRLYDEALAKLTHAEASSRTQRVYSEWFEIPLGLALLGLVIDSLLGRRWRGLAATPRRPRSVAAAAVAAATGLLLLATPTRAHASVESAAKAYTGGRFDDAAREFSEESAKHPKDARLVFNAGDAAYRAGHYDAAEAAFKRALGAGDPQMQQRVLYNQGNVLYRAGEPLKPEAREATIAKWKSAIEAYDGALALDKSDADARFNRDLVKRRLKALEEDQKQEPKKDESQDEKKSSSGSGDQKDSKSGGSGQKQDPGSSGDKDAKSGSSGSTKQPGDQGAGKDTPPSGGARPSAQGENGNPSTPGGSSPTSQGQGKSDPRVTPPGPTAGPTAAAGKAPDPRSEGQPGGGKEDAERGHLSARDARALLGSLRGEERRGVSHGTAAADPTDDLPRKDW